jgi:tRNA-dihydrouridine synthase B
MAINITNKSLFFAPMEGITDHYYRNMIFKNYPDWDYMACDFLRIPSVGTYPNKHILKHYGQLAYEQKEQKNKTIYQILTSENALTELHTQKINALGFKWLDINLGCPSKTVCKNKGGSFLLSETETLKKIVKTIRENFPHTFTAKIRVGYKDDTNFINILKMLEDEGVDAITIHGRTRDQLYKGVANWDYIKEAVKAVSIPIIGNGDIWSLEDIDKYYDHTGAHSIMMARGALKTPWIAKLYKEGVKEETLEMRVEELKKYFHNLYAEIDLSPKLNELGKVRRLKSVCRNIFDPLPEADVIKKKFLLSKTKEEMFNVLDSIQL